MIDKERLRIQLAKHEGNKSLVYDDITGRPIGEGTFVRGKPTIGVGRNLQDRGLSEDEIRYILDNDINDCAMEAYKFPWFGKLDAVRQNAVTELIFNLGPTKFRQFQKFINFMNEGRWAQAGEELKRSLWYTQVKGRADTIIGMIVTGEWPA